MGVEVGKVFVEKSRRMVGLRQGGGKACFGRS